LNPPLLDELGRRLRRHGVPRGYRRRLLGELRDHYETHRESHLRDGHPEAEAIRLAEQRLGTLDDLFNEIIRRRDALPYPQRHPGIVFTLWPVPVELFAVMLLTALGLGLYLLVTQVFHVDRMNPVLLNVVHYAFYGFTYGLPPILAMAFCQLAWRNQLPIGLALVSCVVLSLSGGFLEVHLVQCVASGSVKYFQWFDVNVTRLMLPLAVFALHSGVRFVGSRIHARSWQA